MMEISNELLKILVCPVTKGKLIYNRKAQELVSIDAKLAFPIRDGIPFMLKDEARILSDKEVEIILKLEEAS